MEKLFMKSNYFQMVLSALTPINGISALTKLFYAGKTQKIIFNLLIVTFLLFTVVKIPELLAESLEAAAKREGRVLFYSGMSTGDNQILLSGFQKKYPLVKAEVFRANESGLFQRLISEKRMGQTFADVVHMAGFLTGIYKKEGLLGKYVSPEAKAFPRGFKDPEGFWTAHYSTYHMFIYNTRLVAKTDLPKTYDDLLNPRWKRNIGMSDDEVEWFMGMLDYLGEEKGRQFMKGLAAQEPMLRSGRTLVATLMSAGEFPLALGAVHRTLAMQKEGSPVDMIYLPGPVMTANRALGIHANAPHPNAAKLFMDYVLSREGQTLFTQMSRHPVRLDVTVDPVVEKIRKNLFPIKPRDPDVIQNYKKEYDKIFKKRL